MNIIHLILIAFLLTGAFILFHYQSLRTKSVNWLYLLSFGLASFFVETANHDQPFQNTVLIVVALLMLPFTLDGFLSSSNNGYGANKNK